MKTAYGMRISYWGADVCSSVLRHLSHRRNLRRPGRSWQGLACRSGKSRLILSLFGGAGWLVQMRPSAAATSTRAQARFSTSGAVGHPPSIEFRAVRWRSEEHTSELQSLMRTSYAVFCLKQKNHKTRTTPSPLNHHSIPSPGLSGISHLHSAKTVSQ